MSRTANEVLADTVSAIGKCERTPSLWVTVTLTWLLRYAVLVVSTRCPLLALLLYLTAVPVKLPEMRAPRPPDPLECECAAISDAPLPTSTCESDAPAESGRIPAIRPVHVPLALAIGEALPTPQGVGLRA